MRGHVSFLDIFWCCSITSSQTDSFVGESCERPHFSTESLFRRREQTNPIFAPQAYQAPRKPPVYVGQSCFFFFPGSPECFVDKRQGCQRKLEVVIEWMCVFVCV